MEYFAIFLLEIIALFLVSRRAKQKIARRLYVATKSKKVAIYLFSVLFLPGTYIHEGAHLLMAVILGVPASKFSLFPEFENGSLKLGSVSVAKSNFVKMALIGLSPLVLGLTAVLVSSYLLFSPETSLLIKAALVYINFTVSSTMFLSDSDRVSLVPFIVLVSAILIALYISGASMPDGIVISLKDMVSYANFYLLLPLAVNTFALLL